MDRPATPSPGPATGQPSSKRRLFVDSDEDKDADCPMELDHAEGGRASAPSPSAAAQQPHGEPTPQTPQGQAAAPRLASVESLDALPLQMDESMLQLVEFWVETWSANMVQLQPKVLLGDHILKGAVALVDELFARCPEQRLLLLDSAPHLAAFAAGAMFVAFKLLGVTASSPNRSLMAMATGCHPHALVHFKLELCCSLRWDMAAVLRARGLLY